MIRLSNMKNNLTHEYVSKILSYDHETGLFLWKRSSGKASVGKEAGTVMSKGYRCIWIDGRPYYAHRLAWLMHTGRWPERHIDHINMNRLDNSFGNLRQATNGQNRHNQGVPKNNTSGYKGVCWNKSSQKWQASIKKDGVRTYLGFFDDPYIAHLAYCKASAELHGEYGRVA